MSNSADRTRRLPALLALPLFAMCGQSAAQEPVPAVWKEREFSFFYRSSTAVYSCNALKDRVASILRAVGARPDLKIRFSNCNESVLVPKATVSEPGSRGTWEVGVGSDFDQRTRREQSVNVSVRLWLPVEVTPEVVDELKRDKSRRELVSRATGDPAAMFNDPVLFAAQRRVVTMSHETVGLEPAECELLDQMSSGGFQELGIRVVRKGFVCDRHRRSRIAPVLEVEALVPAAFEGGGTGKAPELREDEAEPAAAEETTGEPASGAAPE